jgi:RNA polymerase sigma factor for flagellar operon FliA
MTVRELVPLTRQQQDLVTQHLGVVDRMVRILSRRYGGLLGHDEMAAAGREGLTRAAAGYDASLGVQFAVFATYRVQGAILDAARKAMGARRETTVLAAHSALSDYLGVQRDGGDVMTDTEDSQRARLHAMAAGAAASLFAGIIGAASRSNMRSDEDAAAARDSRAKAFALLERALGELNERDRRIVELHYREGHELREVATMIGVSYATVRRYHAGALDRLGARLRGGGLKAPPPSAR